MGLWIYSFCTLRDCPLTKPLSEGRKLYYSYDLNSHLCIKKNRSQIQSRTESGFFIILNPISVKILLKMGIPTNCNDLHFYCKIDAWDSWLFEEMDFPAVS